MAKNTDNTAAMIDYLVTRWHLNDAGSRAKCLTWLQKVETEVWGLRDWWWKQVSASWSVVSGTNSYSVAQAISDIYAVIYGGLPLEFMDYAEFMRLFGADTTAGTPGWWTMLPPASSTRYMQFQVWPKPNASGTGSYVVGLAPVELTDSSGSKSQIPDEFRTVLLAGADELAAIHDGQVETAALLKAQRETILQTMVAADGARPRVTRR